MTQAASYTIIRGGRSYTPAAYTTAFGALPPSAQRFARRQPPPSKSSVAPVTSQQPDPRALSRANMEAHIRRAGNELLFKPSLKGLTGKELGTTSMLRISAMVTPLRPAKAGATTKAPSSGTANMRATLARQGIVAQEAQR